MDKKLLLAMVSVLMLSLLTSCLVVPTTNVVPITTVIPTTIAVPTTILTTQTPADTPIQTFTTVTVIVTQTVPAATVTQTQKTQTLTTTPLQVTTTTSQRTYLNMTPVEVDTIVNHSPSDVTSAQRAANMNNILGQWIEWQGIVRDVLADGTIEVDLGTSDFSNENLILVDKTKAFQLHIGQHITFAATIHWNFVIFWTGLNLENGEIISVGP